MDCRPSQPREPKGEALSPGPGVLAVGAVYDRATFASEWAGAVIDRAYSGK
jgi:hypothetical protein